MSAHSISTTVTTTVILGGPDYPSPLTVTSTGVIDPSSHGDVGVYSATAGVLLANDGTIDGASGHHRTTLSGGAGVDFSAAGTITNAGTIHAGAGVGTGDGGVGIMFAAGGSLNNGGTITAGEAGRAARYATNGIAGAGVIFASAGTLTNGSNGAIYGGIGAGANSAGVTAAAGNGVDLAAGSTLTNTGRIIGGLDRAGRYSGGVGGTGVYAVNSSLFNGGLISGGEGGIDHHDNSRGDTGGVGVQLQGGMLTNAGTITGGRGSNAYGIFTSGGTGGVGVVVSSTGTLVNLASGTIVSGAGGYTRSGPVSIGANGVDLTTGALLRNYGTIEFGGGATLGSANYGGTGFGVMAGATTTVDNSGVITGLQSDDTGFIAVYLAGATLSNTGSITGGKGAVIPHGGGFYGGDAVAAGPGSNVFNQGIITGGAGGTSGNVPIEHGGNGGAGVFLNGGTLTTAGVIAGGIPGVGRQSNGIAGDAVQFGRYASTLVLEPRAVFVGQVAAYAGVNDVLRLTGQHGTLTGLGTQFTDFTTLAERPGADWTISGAATLVAGGEVIVRQNAALTLDGALTGPTTIRLDAGATLTADAGLTAKTIRFANGGHETLALNSTDPVTGTLSGFRLTDTIDIASTITTLSAMHGKIILLDHQTAVETLTLDGNFTASQFALTPDDHGGTDITLIAATSTASPITSPSAPASVSLRHDGLMPMALFAMHPHAL